ncbi:MAG: GMC family oxidoreductase N-terminal domain-containing protein [Acidimicrobiales bacterium]
MASRYDVVVIGSGYGGAIAASRFARAGRRVCVLERGAERWPGSYPEHLWSAARDTQISSVRRRVGSRLALYDMRFDDEVNVLVGCGLGGTSLINASVALRPIDAVFADDRWPDPIRSAGGAGLAPYFERAEQWLGSNPYPTTSPELAKLDALRVVAGHLAAPLERAPINVTFSPTTNRAGVTQPACNNCGNCIAGCNVGAKNTVLMNYLPDAVHHGGQIFTERCVDWIEDAGDDGWRVVFTEVRTDRRRFGAPRQFVLADLVVVAAGTMGSTEIMLRSAERGLHLSDRLGSNFNGNGDVLGFGYDSDRDLNAIGWAGRRKGRPVGPTITGVVPVNDRGMNSPMFADRPDARLADDALVIEEGAIPGILRAILPLTLLYTAVTAGEVSLRRRLRMLFRSWAGAARNTLTYLVMSNDDTGGRLVLQNDRVTVDWPTGPTGVHIRRNNDVLAAASASIGASYSPEMLYTKAMGHQLVTVHPLGGCVMADSAELGVVDHRGEAFIGSSGTRTHRGLHVLDGSIVSRPLDTNPSLTIAALAERAVELIAAERGWPLDLRPATDPIPQALIALPAGPASLDRGHRSNTVRFTERMAGWFGVDAETYEDGVGRGEADASPMSFVVTITIDDLAAPRPIPVSCQSCPERSRHLGSRRSP